MFVFIVCIMSILRGQTHGTKIGLLENVCGIVRVMTPVEQLLAENLGNECLSYYYMG